ncbi:MAG: hypothetical protein A2Y62_09480, partial [Candidatus Fischerbacteria bacterium RBG_13_37_8]
MISKKLWSGVICVALLFFITPLFAGTLYVSKAKGENKNPGTKESPVQEIDRAITLATAGDEIYIAGGIYSGTFSIGYLESDKPLKIYGSYDETFATRDIVKTSTVFQPDNASGAKSRKAMLKFTKAVDGTIIDGIVFDSGERNAFSPKEGIIEGLDTGRMLRSTEKPATGNSTVEEPLIQIVSAAQGGDVTVQNCVFINGASFGLQAGHRSGTFRVLNNVFVGNRMAAIEIYGTCPNKGGPKALSLCASVEIAHNTILFTWSRLKDFKDMGYGIRVMTKCEYKIHHNIIGGSVLAGIDNTRFNKDEWLKIDNNIFFVNKQADLEYSPASNTKLNLFVDQFKDLTIASATGNKEEIPKTLPINKTYLEGFLNARYSEQVDFNPDSPANVWREVMGMNKQGKISSQVSMFMNRY